MPELTKTQTCASFEFVFSLLKVGFVYVKLTDIKFSQPGPNSMPLRLHDKHVTYEFCTNQIKDQEPNKFMKKVIHYQKRYGQNSPNKFD
jgi:hypothetical protein